MEVTVFAMVASVCRQAVNHGLPSEKVSNWLTAQSHQQLQPTSLNLSLAADKTSGQTHSDDERLRRFGEPSDASVLACLEREGTDELAARLPRSRQ